MWVGKLIYSLVAILLLTGQTAATVVQPWTDIQRRDPFQVNKYASLGESYAAGPGAGEVYGTDYPDCLRYTEAFGPQVSRSNDIQGSKELSFIACSGSRTEHIYQGRNQSSGGKPKDSQATQLKGLGPDLVTLSIGGNDVGFVTLLDRCVYRFYDVFCIGCGLSDLDCTKDCQAAIDEVSGNIASPEFRNGLEKSIRAIFENASRAKLYIMGYPAFWNVDEEPCDHVSFVPWCNENNVLPLIKDRRLKMNQLTDQLNNKIKEVIEAGATPGPPASIQFVETNPFFDTHRFCEKGVPEPDKENANTFFYHACGGGFQNVDDLPSGDCQAILNDGGNAGDYYGCEIGEAIRGGANVDLANTTLADPSCRVSLSIGLKRLFHPTIAGMTAYKDAIVSAYRAAPPLQTVSSLPPESTIQSSRPPESNPSTISVATGLGVATTAARVSG